MATSQQSAIDEQVLQRIRRYASETRSADEDRMDVDLGDIESRLDQTIQQLQDRVKEQQLALEQLLETSRPLPTHPSSHPKERLRQLRALKTAYDKLAVSPPSLPARGSALPAVLATQIIHETIASEKQAVESTEARRSDVATRLEREDITLKDARLLSTALETRIDRLRDQREEQSQKDPAQVAHDMLTAAKAKKRHFQRESQSLHQAFDAFVDSHLAAMLAAEELGGPVVGNMMEVDEDVLIGGFSSQGKAKKGKNVSEDRRQQRIDQIWGSARDDEAEEPNSEKAASAHELKELLDALLTALLSRDSAGPYVDLTRDSAAARFLVRAKVAQFHPKDARKLRLIDFGRELDD